MRLTYFTDFGLRALMRMASEPDRSFSTAELAAEFGISRNHLIKVMQRLARGGIIATRRGSGGGVLLARGPAEIRVGDVVRLLEEGQAMVSCFSPREAGCTLTHCCRLRHRLRAAEAAFLAELNRSSLADLALAPEAFAAGSQRPLEPA